MTSFNVSFASDTSMTDFFDSTFENIRKLNESTDALIESQKCVANAFIDKIIILYLRHNLTLVCLEDLMQLLNENREICEQLPTHKKQILNMFRENKDLIEVVFFIRCGKCHKIFKKNSGMMEPLNLPSKCCDVLLKRTETNFFVYIPLRKQIIQSIQTNWDDIQNFDTTSEDGIISDVHDGALLKSLLQSYAETDVNILSLCVNVDGANKFNSNSTSLWPVQFLQNYLPPKTRFLPKNIMVSGLLYTEGSFDFREYFLPLIAEMNGLKEDKIVIPIGDEEYTFKPVITHCACDLPAKAKLQETKQFGGYHACTYCHIPGEQVLIKTKGGKGKKKTEKKFVRYPERNRAYPLRDEKETLEKMVAVSSSGSEAIDGIKDVSCLVGLEHFKIIKSVGVEYMHCILLGVQKQITNIFCNPKNSNGKLCITKKNREILNKRLLGIRPNSEVTRKPRSLEKLSLFKASEYRSLLLFYFPICLIGLVPDAILKHVRLLSAATYTLLKSSMTFREIDDAEEMLERFVVQHQKLFGIDKMVMNVHLLKHLADDVRELGPLWCHSAFPFERNNGVLLKKVNGTKDVLYQISSKYCLEKAMTSCGKPGEKPLINEKILLGRKVPLIDESLRVFDVGTWEEVDLSNYSLFIHKRIKLKNVVYTSTSYTLPKKSVDYFIGLHIGLIGKAKFYLEYDGQPCVVLEEFKIIDSIDHIWKVEPTGRNLMASITDIKQKYLYMNVGPHQYITLVPNPYERE